MKRASTFNGNRSKETVGVNSKWPEAAGAIAVVLLACVFVIARTVDQHGWPTDGVAAAWAQAIAGTLAFLVAAVAIWSTICMAEKARQREEALRVRGHADTAAACAAIANDVYVALENHAGKLSEHLAGSYEFPSVGTRRLESLDAAVLALMQKSGDTRTLEHLLVMRRELSYAIQELEMCSDISTLLEEEKNKAIHKAYKRPLQVKCSAIALQELARSLYACCRPNL